MSVSSPEWVSAETSGSAYGVMNIGSLAVPVRSWDSQVAASVLAGMVLAPVHLALRPTLYGWVITVASPSSAGSTAQVRWVLAEYCRPAASSPPSLPPGLRLVASSPPDKVLWHIPCCGWSISGQTQEMSSFCEGTPEAGSQYGRSVRALPWGAKELMACATSG